MYTWDSFSRGHYAFSPQHGGYIGNSYLYTCQQPLCEEPNMPVTDLVAQGGYAHSVKLTWTAGEGNRTIIRAREDKFPTGYDDGRLVVDMESTPGEQLYFFDTEIPSLAYLYYIAYSLTVDEGGKVLQTSFVECEATDTTFVHDEIANEKMSWGKIKSLNMD